MSAGAPAAFNLVDSSGWIEFFTAGANGPVFKPVIEKTEQLLVPTIALFEVHRVLSRGLPPELVDSCLDAMRLARADHPATLNRMLDYHIEDTRAAQLVLQRFQSR